MPRTSGGTMVAREPKYVRLAEIVDAMPKDSSVRQIQAAFAEKYRGERVASSYVSLVRGGLGRNGKDDRQPSRGRRPNVRDCVYADDVRRVNQMVADCGGSGTLEKVLDGIEVCGGIRGVRRVLKMGKTMR
jgi:hypothetical protein